MFINHINSTFLKIPLPSGQTLINLYDYYKTIAVFEIKKLPVRGTNWKINEYYYTTSE